MIYEQPFAEGPAKNAVSALCDLSQEDPTVEGDLAICKPLDILVKQKPVKRSPAFDPCIKSPPY